MSKKPRSKFVESFLNPKEPGREVTPGKMDLAGIPLGLRSAKWADFEALPEVLPVRNYVASLRGAVKAGDGVFIGGGRSTGKSRIAAYIAKAAIWHRFEVIWVTALTMQDRIYSREVMDDPEDPVSWASKFRNVPVLVVDDFGGELEGVRGANRVVQVLRDRQTWKRPTIITSSFAVNGIVGAYGDGYDDWLFDNFLCVILETKAPRPRVGDRYAEGQDGH